jgi:putative transposase
MWWTTSIKSSRPSSDALKAGDKARYPRYKSKDRWKGFGLQKYDNGFKLDRRRLRIHGVGRIAVPRHRPLEGQIKTLRIVKRAEKWYAATRWQ